MEEKNSVYRFCVSLKDFDGKQFSNALSHLLSEPVYEDVADVVKNPEEVYSARMSYTEDDFQLMKDLKEFYDLSSNTELVRLVIHAAKNNPLFWKHTPQEDVAIEGCENTAENNTKPTKTAKIAKKGK